MNYILKIKNLSQTRLKQLDTEEKFDFILKENSKKCSQLVNTLLFEMRDYNRRISKETLSLNLVSSLEKVYDNMAIMDDIFNKYRDVKCEDIEKLIREIRYC